MAVFGKIHLCAFAFTFGALPQCKHGAKMEISLVGRAPCLHNKMTQGPCPNRALVRKGNKGYMKMRKDWAMAKLR